MQGLVIAVECAWKLYIFCMCIITYLNLSLSQVQPYLAPQRKMPQLIEYSSTKLLTFGCFRESCNSTDRSPYDVGCLQELQIALQTRRQIHSNLLRK